MASLFWDGPSLYRGDRNHIVAMLIPNNQGKGYFVLLADGFTSGPMATREAAKLEAIRLTSSP